MRRPRPALLLAAALLAASSGPGRGEGRLPYRLAVRVEFAPGEGAASFRDEAAQAIVAELRARGCFEDVRLAPASGAWDADLLLDVTLADLRQEIRYDQSIADRTRPGGEAEAATENVVLVSLRAEIVLAARPGGAVVRERGLHVQVARRPRVPGDDAQAGARTDAARDLAKRARTELCRGSASRLTREIEAARRAP